MRFIAPIQQYSVAIAAVLMLVINLSAGAQTLKIFDIDAVEHPNMRAKFSAFDAQGNPQRPTASEVRINENGMSRTITRVTCPPPNPPKALSSVLVIDVSGSMSKGAGSVSNIELAKVAARAWVQGLPFGASECAITSFDSRNYLNLDFTTDRNKALAAIATLRPNGGTDYDMAMINRTAGGLVVSKRGRHQRVIVFLTDGQPNTPPNVSAIIDEANRQNCVVFCVTLGIPAPKSLRDIASGTGGQVFEKVTTVQEAEDVYLAILRSVQGYEPCTIEWLSEVACREDQVVVGMTWLSRTSQDRYTIPKSRVAALEFSPSYFRFDKPPVGQPVSQAVSVTARNWSFAITNIVSSNPDFAITPTRFSLQPGQTASLTLTYTAADSGYAYSRFAFENELCQQFLYASGSYSSAKPKDRTLTLIHPNGGETFVVGSDTVILWEGVPPEELVLLEYSVDNGTTWKTIDTARGLTYAWRNVPRPTSGRCLARVRQYSGPNGRDAGQPRLVLKAHFGAARCLDYSPDGSMLATGGFDGMLQIWNPVTGQLIRTIADDGYPFESVMFSPDNTSILSSSDACRIHDFATGSVTHLFEDYSIPGVSYSPDGGMVASSRIGGPMTLWNVQSGSPIQTFANSSDVQRIIYSSDGFTVATLNASRGLRLRLWNPITGDSIHTIYAYDPGVDRSVIQFGPEGKSIAFSNGNKISVIDIFSKQVIKEFTTSSLSISSIAFSRDGSLLAVGSGNDVELWDVATGSLIRKFDPQNNGAFTTGVTFSPDGKTLAASKGDGTVKLWIIDELPIQEDLSDSLFAIVEPLPQALDVDMQRCLVDATKDSVVTGLVRNVGTYPFVVRSIAFSGSDASAFSLVSGLPAYSVGPAAARNGEIRFQPKRVGLHTAQMVVETQSGPVTASVRGIGVAPSLLVVAPVVDFGRVALGDSKDTVRVASIQNFGSETVTITDVQHAGPNAVDFSTLAGGGGFTLKPGETRLMDLRFTPTDLGRTSGTVEFSYNGPGSPAIMQLFGEATQCSNRQLTYPLQEMRLVGDATFDSASINLTPSRTYTAGVAWFPKKILVAGGFDIRFRFAMYDGADNGLPDYGAQGADGIALVIQNTKKFDVGMHGDGIGYHGIPSGLAVEFDAYRNPAFADPTPNHIAVQVGDGRILRPWHLPPYLRAITSLGVPSFTSDGTVYHARITLQGQRLSVYCDTVGDLTKPILVVDSLDLGAYMRETFDGSSFVGFTSATGLSQQQHKLFGLTLDDCAQLVSVGEDETQGPMSRVSAHIVPTPSHGEARIEFNEPLPALAHCTVYDARGLDVASFEVSAGSVSSPLTLKGLPFGSYRVQVLIDHHVIVLPLLLVH